MLLNPAIMPLFERECIMITKKTATMTNEKLQDIYTDIFSYYDATDSQNLPDKKYPYATVLQHAIRSHLARLRKERVVVSLKRAHYKLLK